MGCVHLVRHGQASLGAADYDQLSELGLRQCQALGRFWRERGLGFDAVMTGSLKRHAQSLAGLAEGLGQALPAQVWPGLDEYDSEALMRAVHPGELARPLTAEATRQHFRLLREGLRAWMAGRSEPAGMPSYADFTAGVTAALAHAQALAQSGPEARVLIVSSGGPISTALAQLLAAPTETAIELNLRLRNSAVSELLAAPKRLVVLGFNSVAHLEQPGMPAQMLSYA